MAKYSPISEFLTDQAADRIRLDFTAVERLLGLSLPRSAEEYQAWWANDASHSQARAWLDAGWQTENLDLSRRTVEFVRVRKKKPGPVPDPWGALKGTVMVHDATALVTPSGENWEAEAGAS